MILHRRDFASLLKFRMGCVRYCQLLHDEY
jgi:hypothetical protein